MIGIENKRTSQEIIMRTEEVETMIGSRMTTGEILQEEQGETSDQDD